MADLEFYKLSMSGEEADSGIRTGMEAGATSGVLLGDGNGGVTAATPGRDFGYPLLQGNGPPTGNTAANIGQHYFDMQATAAPYEYICVGLNANGFIWIVFGDTGDGFKISGYFVSLEALEAAISAGTVAAPTEGTAYGIGEAAPYDIYVWDAVNSDWVNNGPLGASGGSGVPPHGTTGQVLTKLSDRDGDAGWKDIALKGEGAPTTSTVGMIGQLYIDTTATENPAYICVGITTADNVTTYVWQPVGGTIEDGSITAEKLAPNAIPDALGYNPGMVNPNLIDNWYFGNPVNQRGWTSGVLSFSYWLDRWIGNDITATVGYGYVSLRQSGTSNLFNLQRVEPTFYERALAGRTITLSALFANGNLEARTVVAPAYQSGEYAGGNANGLILDVYSTENESGFRLFPEIGYSFDIVAVKAEFGSKQTLAHRENGVWVLNEIPDYGEQLARCQRYYIASPKGQTIFRARNTTTYIITAINFAAAIWFPVEMRTNPAVTIYYDINDGPAQTSAPVWATKMTASLPDIGLNPNDFLDLTHYVATADL